MPIVKKSESLPARPVVILLYGEPGIGKTSLFNTSNNPLLIDFDRGVDRAIHRQDTLVVNRWEDVQQEEKTGTFKGYQTIGIDTAKSALDDFLMDWAVRNDYTLRKNKLKAYGAIADEFKLFVSNRRSEQADIVIIAHAKDEKEGDVIRKTPDVTGGSYSLLLRIADQIGYIRTVNNKRTVQFEPTDTSIGKNVARLPLIEIPDQSDPAFPTFMAVIIKQVRDAISEMSEAQKEALQKMETFRTQIAECTDPDDLTSLLLVVKEMPKSYRAALEKEIVDRSKALNFTVNKELKKFEAPAQREEPKKEIELPSETRKKREWKDGSEV